MLTMTFDDWRGFDVNAQTINDPSWEEVRNAIESLNQQSRTEVLLQSESGDEFLIGGGNDRFIVCLTTADDRNLTLVNPSGSGVVKERVVASGQPGDFRSNIVVRLEAALRAAKAFVITGTLAADQTWESA